MKGNIYLIGGGEIAKGETREIDLALMNEAPQGSSFVFFGTAAGESEGYFATISSVFGEHFTVGEVKKGEGRDVALAKIKSAAVIYLGGGTTQLLLDLFSEWDLVPSLREAHERGCIIAGMSAGALALSSWYIHEEENREENHQALKQGWGLVNVCTLVHATPERTASAKALWESDAQGSGDANESTFLAINEGSTWCINESEPAGSEQVEKIAP